MTRRFPTLKNSASPEMNGSRSGATLVEVLMSIMIISIGVLSVFLLFPTSLVNSIRATQSTQSRLFAEQISASVKIRPEILLGAKSLDASLFYPPGSFVTPPVRDGYAFPTDVVYYRNETDEYIQPPTGEPGVEYWAQWTAYRFPYPFADFSVQTQSGLNYVNPVRYVVDPYGFKNEIVPDSRIIFGNNLAENDFNPLQRVKTLRIPGLLVPRFEVNEVATQAVPTTADDSVFPISLIDGAGFAAADSWSVVQEWPVTVEFVSPYSLLTFEPGFDVTALGSETSAANILAAASAEHPLRLVGLNQNKTRSSIGYFTGVQGDGRVTVFPPLLTSGEPVTSIRLEQFNRRYTWMAAVNRDSPLTRVQYAIFFNRSFDPRDEQCYDYRELNEFDPPVAFDPSELGTRVRLFAENSSPDLSKGRYVFDTGQNCWFKIVASNEVESGVFELDLESRTYAPGLALPPTSIRGQMIVMPGIVHVYELEL